MKAKDIISFFQCLPDDTEVKLQNVYLDEVQIVPVKHIAVQVLSRGEDGNNTYTILLS